MDDQELLHRFRAGDPTAFGRLVDRYEAPLASYVERLTHDPALAQDVTQETSLALVESARNGMDPSLVRAWLYQVARNGARDAVRKETRMRARERTAAIPEALPGPDRELEQGEEACRVAGLLATLPAEILEVLCLKVLDGLTYREIATVTGHSVGKVGALLHDGVSRLATGVATNTGLPRR